MNLSIPSTPNVCLTSSAPIPSLGLVLYRLNVLLLVVNAGCICSLFQSGQPLLSHIDCSYVLALSWTAIEGAKIVNRPIHVLVAACFVASSAILLSLAIREFAF